MAPEMLLSGEHGLSFDYYTLGALLFELLTGLPPFYDKNRSRMRWKILNEELEVPGFVSKAAKALLTGLLEKNPDKRLGTLGAHQVKEHEFCSRVNWNAILAKEVKPPLRPHIRRSNFDPEYKKVQIDPEFFRNSAFADTGFEGFEFDSDGRGNELGPGEVSCYSNLTSTTNVSAGDRSRASEGSRKNRSEILSTEFSRNEDGEKKRVRN